LDVDFVVVDKDDDDDDDGSDGCYVCCCFVMTKEFESKNSVLSQRGLAYQ